MEWTDVWKPPFWTDHYGYVWDKDNVMTFTAEDLSPENDKEIRELCRDIVAALNGEQPGRVWTGLYVQDGCDLYRNNILLGSFRGWGHLTGGLKLSGYEAAKVQDQLIIHVLRKLSGVAVIKVQPVGKCREE